MSGAASPDRWGDEHAIDLGAVDAPADEAPPVPTTIGVPRRRFRFPNAAMALAAVLFLVAAGAIAVAKWSPFGKRDAEGVVTAFLEAAQAGDIRGALAFTDQPHATGDFLVDEALDTRWSIVEVGQVASAPSAREGRYVSQVYAEIEAFDGTRIGFRYFVGIEDGEVRIENALSGSEAYPAFDHLDVNGVTVPVDEALGITNIVLLPGIYEFYPELPSTMELETEGVLLTLGNRFIPLGGDYADEWLPIPWPTVSAEGAALIDRALRAHLDACALDTERADCPFAFPEDDARTIAPAPGAVWEITAYPTVRAQWWGYELLQGFTLVTTVPGEARMAVVVTEDGESRETVVSCPVWADGLYADLDFDGGAVIRRPDGTTLERCSSLVEVG
ncbi:hypothetical protein [Glycomyces artemisiae]|uniref:DUF4878 domain-containing protein n=1 Tax=Glycomyces artemisiae TaxID=1076443 RepID=A0A2T0UVI8_9ACTN|nr:hypothetical protein [Glycomyces artemisiae]PRY61914.1 hypothetical protein B0I28_101238 [Glycomyces artemisiae]